MGPFSPHGHNLYGDLPISLFVNNEAKVIGDKITLAIV
jgi:hypothetical protein